MDRALTPVFIVDRRWPSRPIVTAQAELVGKKWRWARVKETRSFLLGATAFFTLEQARRSQLARLMQVVKSSYLRNCHYAKWITSKHALEKMGHFVR